MNIVDIRVVMALLLLLVLLLIWRGLKQRDKSASLINLDDLLLGEDGKASKAAAVMYVALIATTWAFVLAALRGTLTDIMFGAYGALWVSPTLTRLFTNRPSDSVATSETSTVSTTRTAIPTETP